MPPSNRVPFTRTLLPILLLAVGLVTAGCGDDPVSENPDPDDPDPDPEVEVTASMTVDPAGAEIGDQVTLNGSESSVEMSFEWSLTTPEGSEASVEDPSAETTSFEVDGGGTFEIALEVSAEEVTDSETEVLEVPEIQGHVYSSSHDEGHLASSEGERTWVYTELTGNVRGLAVDADGYLYTASEESEVHKINLDGSQVWTYTEHEYSAVNAVAVDADGYVYTAAEDFESHKITPDGEQVWAYTEHTSYIYGVAVLPGAFSESQGLSQ